MTTRDVALAVVRDVFGPSKRAAQASFDYRVRRAELSPRDRAFAAELAYGSIKMRRTLDWYLAPYVAGRSRPLPAPVAEALRLGAYQLRFMNGVEQHAAVSETVSAALRVGHRGTAGLVNAVLRRLIADDPLAPARDAFSSDEDFLGTRYSVPTWLAARWRGRLGARAEDALAGIDAAPQLALSVDSRSTSVDGALELLAIGGAEFRRSAFVRDAVVATRRPNRAVEDEPGRWWVQSESAAIPADVLDPQPGETVVDLCSGRGNKALLLWSRMGGDGTLVCVEIDERKCDELRDRLAAYGAQASIACADATAAGEPVADAVLLDAPCSADGVFGRHPEARWRKSPDDAARLAVAQSKLLTGAATRVRPGGRIVYSVCSIERSENEAVVDAFLSEDERFVRGAAPERYAPFATAAGDILVPPGIDGRDGFYVALLRRAA